MRLGTLRGLVGIRRRDRRARKAACMSWGRVGGRGEREKAWKGGEGPREGGRAGGGRYFSMSWSRWAAAPPRAGVEERGPVLLQAGVPQGHGQHVPKEVPKWSRQTMPQNAHFPNTALTRSQTAPTTTHSKTFTKLPLPATESANPPA